MKVVILDPSCFGLLYDHCLCEELTRQGCQALFIGSRRSYDDWTFSGSYEQWEHFYRISNYIYKKGYSGKGRVFLKGVEHLFDMERLVHRLQIWKPDIIHFQWLPLPVVDTFFLPRLRNLAPLILTVHDTQPFHGSPSSRVQLLGLSKAIHSFDHYIVHTRYSREQLIKGLGVQEEASISVIPHGVFDYYKTIWSNCGKIEKVKWADAKKTLLFFGVIKPYKGLDLLIEAFARLSEKVRNETCLLIAGYPRVSIKPLQDLAKKLGISEHIVWDLRFIPEREVANIFESASVVILPYRRIDQSGVLMTALAFGKPIIATRVGGFSEIIENGVHGYLVEPGDVQGLANAMEKILSYPDIAHKMGEAVRKLVSTELSWNAIAQKTVQLYRSLCN